MSCYLHLTAGPLSDSGLGTWAQSDAPQDKMSQPMSDLDTIDSGLCIKCHI